MYWNISFIILYALTPLYLFSQEKFDVEGIVIDAITQKPLTGVFVAIDGMTLTKETGTDGTFKFDQIPFGTYILQLETTGYRSTRLPIVVDAHKNMGSISLEREHSQEQADDIITLSENDLNDEGNMGTISGLLQASRDVFSNIAAFEFSQAFFSVRGLGAEHGVVLLNGIKMNKQVNGRPQWNNWGGLNDVTRNQELAPYASPSDHNFGGLLGTNAISTRVSNYRPGYRISLSSSNRSYAGRLMATYTSGFQGHKFAYTVSASRRWATSGFAHGTPYDAASVFGAFEYKINPRHSINVTAIYSPVRSGKSSPKTLEVAHLKGSRYNSYWGYQNGKIRSSRVREIQEPLFMLSHYWTINHKSRLHTNMAYQTGKTGNSRLDFGGTTAITTTVGDVYYSGGATNPDPVYYKKLPSFFLSSNDAINYEEAHHKREAFVNDGQIDWDALYAANTTSTTQGRNAAYILFEDRNDDRQLMANVIFNTHLSENIAVDAAINYRKLKSENFANVLDLLGGEGYLDVNPFAKHPTAAPNDLQHTNRIVQEGDRFKYHYNLHARVIDGFVQTKFRFKAIDFHLSSALGTTTYQREGLYQNGAFPHNSLGKGKALNFIDFSGKAGITYKISGRHRISMSTAYLQHAPTLNHIFSNAREHHDVVRDLTSLRTKALDFSYIHRSSRITSRLSGYYYNTSNATNVSFSFVDGIYGSSSSFIQQIMTGIERRNMGLEFGMEAHITSAIKVKGAAALGEFIYNNTPNLYITSNDFEEDYPVLRANLKHYKIASGPQRAFSAGFEYRDPDFWWFGASANYFSNAYVGINALTRTENFYRDADGFPFVGYDENIAKRLLKQEKLNGYYLVHLIGGKSWRIHRKYKIGIFASISNVLNQEYKTGGFEQARNGNYRLLLEEHQNTIPVFGTKYWFGRGTSYFMNIAFNF